MNLAIKMVLIVLSSLLALVMLVFVGLQVQPTSFPAITSSQDKLETIPLPVGLPAPVARFYQKIYGNNIPTHVAGRDYRHYIEATIFGLPILKINGSYIAGSSRMAMPWGTTENDPRANQGANLAVWAEALWFPSIFLTDPRVHWNAVDDVTATLRVPFEASTETFIARFDPVTNLLSYLESMRFKTDQKVLWLNQARVWGDVGGTVALKESAVIWMDDGKPWATFEVEEIEFNVDVSKTIGGTGL